MAKWCAGFAKLDADALSSLYSKNAFFFGSNPKLYRGRDGVADYFNGLPRWRQPSVRFTDVRTAAGRRRCGQHGRDGRFPRGETAELSVKITWVIVREDGDWKIVSHHVSSKARR